MKKFILFSFVAVISFNSYGKSYDPTDDLIVAFGSKCKGKGAINNDAYKDGSALKSIVQSIKDDPTCAGISGALGDISNLNVSDLVAAKGEMSDLEYSAMQANDLELALKAETNQPSPDSDYITKLKEVLVDTKVNLAKSQNYANQTRTRTRLETIGNFQKYSAVLFARLKVSEQCLTRNPNLPAQLGAQILGLGATVASGLVGSLLLSTGTLIDGFVSFVRERSLGNKIENLMNNRLGDALGCGLEGLSYTYCQARDVETVINFNKNKSENPISSPSWLDGAGAIGQDLQGYMDWVSAVDSGSPAATKGRASDKKSAFALQNDLRAAKTDLDGILNSGKLTVRKSANKLDATRKALSDMAGKMTSTVCDVTGGTSSCSYGGPFVSMFSADPSCGPLIYLSSGGKDFTRNDAGLSSCSAYVARTYPTVPDIETEVGPLIDNVIEQGTEAVNIQLSQVNESNPNLVLAKFDSSSRNGRTARDFLNSSLAYLNTLLDDPTSIAQRKNQRDLIEKTKKQIIASLDIVDKDLPPAAIKKNSKGATVGKSKDKEIPVPGEALDKVLKLSEELIPVGDSSALPKALSEIINQDIDQRIAKGQIEENLAALMRLSSNDSLTELIKYYIGLEPARTQARSAKSLSKNNLDSLASMFDDSIEKKMQKFSDESKSDPQAAESLALLCMQTLAVPDSPKIGSKDVSPYCKDKIYKDVHDKSGIEMNYAELSKKSYPEKACAVYDFYRKSYLYDLKTNRGSGPGTRGAPTIKTQR